MRFTYQLLGPTGFVAVAVDVRRGDQLGDIEYQGDETSVREVRAWLELSTGAFGHLIGARAAPVDLHVAMQQPAAQRFTPTLIEGRALIEARWAPELPEDVVT